MNKQTWESDYKQVRASIIFEAGDYDVPVEDVELMEVLSC